MKGGQGRNKRDLEGVIGSSERKEGGEEKIRCDQTKEAVEENRNVSMGSSVAPLCLMQIERNVVSCLLGCLLVADDGNSLHLPRS